METLAATSSLERSQPGSRDRFFCLERPKQARGARRRMACRRRRLTCSGTRSQPVAVHVGSGGVEVVLIVPDATVADLLSEQR